MDVVYLVRRGDTNEELRYSLRTLSNLPHVRVWFVGHRPSWVQGVEHIPGNRSPLKAVNVFRGVLAACEHPEVSDEFVMMNDDFFILGTPDLAPKKRGSLRDHLTTVRSRRDPWALSLRLTLTWLTEQGIEDPASYELHRPLLVDKAAMADALRSVGDYGHPTPPQWRTVYGNLHAPDAEQAEDCRVRKWTPDEEITGPLLSSSDATFPRVQPLLERLFPDPSPFEAALTTAGR